MNPLELLRAALKQRGFGLGRMILTVRRKRPPQSERIRIAGPGSPLARVVGSMADGRYQVDVSIADVEAWVEPMLRRQIAFCMQHLGAIGFACAVTGTIADPTFELTDGHGPAATMSLEDASSFVLWLDPPTDAQQNRSDST